MCQEVLLRLAAWNARTVSTPGIARRCLLPETASSMEFETLVPGIVGAFVGVIGWLVVGILIQRRQFLSQARSARRKWMLKYGREAPL